MIPLAYCGYAKLGSVQMRGVWMAQQQGVPFFDLGRVLPPPCETLVVVKRMTPDPHQLRRCCRNLILDPLDCWEDSPHMEPVAFWRKVQSASQADAMLATSPSCAELMRAAGVREVILKPHHADPRIEPGWYDPSGPVVYAGLRCFLGGQEEAIRSACAAAGREFVCRSDHRCWEALRGASLALCVRLGKSRTPLNLTCKPAVKVANAIAAGVPILATDDPAIRGLGETPYGSHREVNIFPPPSVIYLQRVDLAVHCRAILGQQ